MSNFTVISPEFKDQERLQLVHEFDGFDGTGQNRSPALQWHGAPAGTRSFALTLYDPDAPTGSGFWHWILFDIDSPVAQLAAGVGSPDATDLGASGTQVTNDYGATGYGGPCPPKGLPAHRYIFTVHALGVQKLEPPANAPNAVVRFLIYQNTLATATLTGLYNR
ncbi:YbhB/YbcL family Raf kinase inhibitor-like protein [Paraburkholderia phytofirmans]